MIRPVYTVYSSVLYQLSSSHSCVLEKTLNILYFSLPAMHLFGLNWQLQQTENDTFENGKVNSEVVPTHTVYVPAGDNGKKLQPTFNTVCNCLPFIIFFCEILFTTTHYHICFVEKPINPVINAIIFLAGLICGNPQSNTVK